jgi:hypothetical protein
MQKPNKEKAVKNHGDALSSHDTQSTPIAVASLTLYHSVRPIAPIASGSHPAQPFLSREVAVEVVEVTTSRTGFLVVTV